MAAQSTDTEIRAKLIVKGGTCFTQQIHLRLLIEEVIRRFTRNRIGPKPVVFVKIPPKLLYLPSRNESLEKLIRVYLYESLLMGNPDTPVRIMIHRPAPLKDLESFVGICPIYWTQLRIQMHGLCILNNLVKEKFSEIGYDCEEWVGVENATAQLAIFGSSWPGTKVIFCADVAKDVTKYDLLIPVSSPSVDS